MTKVLYISYDGMTDPLGQSQVMPYLVELSKNGYDITIISFEKETAYTKSGNDIENYLQSYHIEWIPLKYTKRPPVISTIWDIIKLKRKVFNLYKTNQYEIVHCRSYISALVGIKCKFKYRSKFIFDMRGFWADERVDGKIWNLINPIYSLIYGYFKMQERKFIFHADHIVVLTHQANKIIKDWFEKRKDLKITVIPCSVDMELFNYNNINKEQVSQLKNILNIKPDTFILSYVGSIGTWYMLPEMLDFFTVLLSKIPNSVFLFISKENKHHIVESAIKKSISKESIIVIPAERIEVPQYISLSSASIFFIKPCFSKKASSPTKQGELMSMGVPIICNSGIGDTDLIINESSACALINEFNEKEYSNAIDKILSTENIPKSESRNVASKYYDLKKGAASYLKIYKSLENTNDDMEYS